ncbi:oligosaccharide flippase family protein [Colwellia sp. C1TZA3]|uniref:oligosaccharide flippase family protein n=1 Tax=Colwellia sp. C1TZA3 TaxID=2508879 RepID=UPI0011B98438|nr:oligosaccharide flippase family protein [Colwellia sp. C1TZA3]TWX72950.1 oligosaccharide flippase family protein [Colwellia sp. C1TZA3]
MPHYFQAAMFVQNIIFSPAVNFYHIDGVTAMITLFKKHISRFIYVFVFKISGAIATMYLYIMLSQSLGAAAIGQFYLAQSLITFATLVGLLGLGNAVIKYSSWLYEKNDFTLLNTLRRKALGITFICSLISTFLIYFLASNISVYFFKNPNLTVIIQWMSISIIPFNIIAVFVSLFKGVQKPIYATIFESLMLPTILLVFIFIFKSIVTVEFVAMLYSAAIILSCICIIIVWNRTLPKSKKQNNELDDIKILSTSLPLFWVAIMTFIMGFCDIIMLGIWHDDFVVGIYATVVKVASVSTMFLVIANTLVSPKIAVFYKSGNWQSLRLLIKYSTYLMTLIALVFLLLFGFYGAFILSFFGGEFLKGATSLMIYSIGQFFVLATGPVAVVLMMTGKEKFHRNTVFLSLLLNISLNYMLIPKYGAVGAAMATSISLAIKNIIAAFYVNKLLYSKPLTN